MRYLTLVLTAALVTTGCSYISGKDGDSGRDNGGGSSGSGNATGGSTQTYSGTVTGKASYRERIMLPPDAVVRAQLVDASGPGRTVVAEQQFPTGGKGPPYDLTLKYDPAKINPQGTYQVQVEVLVRGKPRFTTTAPPRVITGGNASTFDVVLTAARQ
ncbi:MAG: hypothetical protein AMXMBFR58_21300 [Phycisphaerae bacterium]|nr:hypothetical protein [Phycisphaerales bacterium]MCK6476793.1 YbaY family lipoprotein [Phycisphaerales bacterium]